MSIAPLHQRLRAALREDGAFHDVTSKLIFRAGGPRLRADVIAKGKGVVCGLEIFSQVLRLLSRRTVVRRLLREGAPVTPGKVVARVTGPARSVLAGERVAVNLLCWLSGVATVTRRYVDAVRGTRARILDTRKTTPLWRDIERYAVRCGGGHNHRFSLSDAVMVKDNHWTYLHKKAESLVRALERRTRGPKPEFVSVEATSIQEVWEAIKANADIILLDNMSDEQIKEAILFIQAAREGMKSEKPWIECTGGITVERARRIARFGVDRISVGSLTHSAPALDFSLEVR